MLPCYYGAPTIQRVPVKLLLPKQLLPNCPTFVQWANWAWPSRKPKHVAIQITHSPRTSVLLCLAIIVLIYSALKAVTIRRAMLHVDRQKCQQGPISCEIW